MTGRAVGFLCCTAAALAGIGGCGSTDAVSASVARDPAAGGTLVEWHEVPSAHLQHRRNVTIWLPPGYEKDGDRRYPVIYAHDGQNLFVADRSFSKVAWRLDVAIASGMEARTIEPAIVVGVWNTPDRRREYSPWDLGPQYARFLSEELMPQVNLAFRTRVGPASTATIGASMGGLISFWLCWKHPDRFGLGGCLSTHFVFSAADAARARGDAAAAEVAATTPLIDDEIAAGAPFAPKPRPRLWLDHGTINLDERYGPVQLRVDAWLEREGMRRGTDFESRVFEGADHNEAAWGSRVGEVLRFLLPATARDPRRRRQGNARGGLDGGASIQHGAGSLRTVPWTSPTTS